MSMKKAYEEKLQAQLDEWNAEIEKLKAKADKAEADAKIEYYEQIEKLREQQQEAQAKLNELRRAGEDAWEDLKGRNRERLGQPGGSDQDRSIAI